MNDVKRRFTRCARDGVLDDDSISTRGCRQTDGQGDADYAASEDNVAAVPLKCCPTGREDGDVNCVTHGCVTVWLLRANTSAQGQRRTREDSRVRLQSNVSRIIWKQCKKAGLLIEVDPQCICLTEVCLAANVPDMPHGRQFDRCSGCVIGGRGLGLEQADESCFPVVENTHQSITTWFIVLIE